MNAGKLVVLILLALLAAWAYDAGADDQVAICKLRAHYVVAGAMSHHYKMPRALKWVSIEEQTAFSLAHKGWKTGDVWPLEFNMIRDDGEPVEIKQVIEFAYQQGWDLGDSHPEANPEALRQPAFDVCRSEQGA